RSFRVYCRKLTVFVFLGACFFLSGCSPENTQDYIEATDPVAASGLVMTESDSGSGFLIDREERLFVTNLSLINGQEDIRVVFPAPDNGRPLVRKAAFLPNSKEQQRVTRAPIPALDPRRDLAILRVTTVPPGTAQLKLAQNSPDKEAPMRFLSGSA